MISSVLELLSEKQIATVEAGFKKEARKLKTLKLHEK